MYVWSLFITVEEYKLNSEKTADYVKLSKGMFAVAINRGTLQLRNLSQKTLPPKETIL